MSSVLREAIYTSVDWRAHLVGCGDTLKAEPEASPALAERALDLAKALEVAEPDRMAALEMYILAWKAAHAHPMALVRARALCLELGELTTAAKISRLVYQQTEDGEHLLTEGLAWIDAGQPDRAVPALMAAEKKLAGDFRVTAALATARQEWPDVRAEVLRLEQVALDAATPAEGAHLLLTAARILGMLGTDSDEYGRLLSRAFDTHPGDESVFALFESWLVENEDVERLTQMYRRRSTSAQTQAEAVELLRRAGTKLALRQVHLGLGMQLLNACLERAYEHGLPDIPGHLATLSLLRDFSYAAGLEREFLAVIAAGSAAGLPVDHQVAVAATGLEVAWARLQDASLAHPYASILARSAPEHPLLSQYHSEGGLEQGQTMIGMPAVQVPDTSGSVPLAFQPSAQKAYGEVATAKEALVPSTPVKDVMPTVSTPSFVPEDPPPLRVPTEPGLPLSAAPAKRQAPSLPPPIPVAPPAPPMVAAPPPAAPMAAAPMAAAPIAAVPPPAVPAPPPRSTAPPPPAAAFVPAPGTEPAIVAPPPVAHTPPPVIERRQPDDAAMELGPAGTIVGRAPAGLEEGGDFELGPAGPKEDISASRANTDDGWGAPEPSRLALEVVPSPGESLLSAPGVVPSPGESLLSAPGDKVALLEPEPAPIPEPERALEPAPEAATEPIPEPERALEAAPEPEPEPEPKPEPEPEAKIEVAAKPARTLAKLALKKKAVPKLPPIREIVKPQADLGGRSKGKPAPISLGGLIPKAALSALQNVDAKPQAPKPVPTPPNAVVRAHRLPLPADVIVALCGDNDADPLSMVTRDISETGMFLLSEYELEIGAEVEVEVTLPSLDDWSVDGCQLRGTVVRREDGLGLGIHFSEPPKEFVERIRELVNSEK